MISSTRSSCTACIAAVYGSGWAIWPCASMPAPRSAASARRRRRSASGWSCRAGSLWGQISRKLAGGSLAARSLIDCSRVSPSTVSLAITSTFASPPSRERSTTTCSTGMSPAALRICVDDEAVGRDSRLGQAGEGLVEPTPRGRGARVLVDDIALARRVHRADDRHLEAGLGVAPHRLGQLLPGDRLVRDHQEVAHRSPPDR